MLACMTDLPSYLRVKSHKWVISSSIIKQVILCFWIQLKLTPAWYTTLSFSFLLQYFYMFLWYSEQSWAFHQFPNYVFIHHTENILKDHLLQGQFGNDLSIFHQSGLEIMKFNIFLDLNSIKNLQFVLKKWAYKLKSRKCDQLGGLIRLE